MVSKKTRPAGVAGTNSTNGVNTFMDQLDHPRLAEIEAVRAIILGADTRINETIKWNAPSFSTSEHFATFRLQPHNVVQVVFHTGAKVKSTTTEMRIDDPAHLLKWVTTDRCTVTFADMEDVEAKAVALQAIVRQWIDQM